MVSSPHFCILGIAVGVKDCPDCPVLPEPEGEHLFYVGGPAGGDSRVKIFSVEQSKFIDSLTVRFERFQMAVTDDDGLLLVAGYPTGLDVIDLKIKETIHSVDSIGGHVTVSPDGRYFVTDSEGPVYARQIYTVDGFQLVYSDTTPSGLGDFSVDSRYYIYPQTGGTVVAYSLAADSIETTFDLTLNEQALSVFYVWPDVDNTKLFFVADIPSMSFLGVTDFGEDAARVLQSDLNTGSWDAVVSRDNKYLYFVNGPYRDYEPGSYRVDVYDVGTEQRVAIIPTRVCDHGYCTVDYEPYEIALTSDGEYLMAISDGFFHNPNEVLLVNAASRGIVGVYMFGQQQQVLALCTKR